MPHTAQHIDETLIGQLQQILQDNLEKEHFGVSELAMTAGISRSNLHRKVHAYNGNSTSQFIREFRLKKAMEMLRSEELTVAEIAYRVGFSSPTYFNTCFKDYYGYPPGEAKLIEQYSSNEKNRRPEIFREKSRPFKPWVFGLIIALILVVSTSYFIRKSELESSVQSEYIHADKSIAVLPLKNWSGNPDLDYIGDGMTDAIITRLTKISSISQVTPFASVLQFKNSEKSANGIADELGVTHILEGNFQLSGDQIKIKLHLIDGRTNSHFWSEEYNGTWTSDDVFQIQANVVEYIAERMNVAIFDEEKAAVNKIPTQNREAYNYWLKARYQSLKYTKQGMENAVPLFEKAISLDSTFFEPYVDLAYLYLLGGASWGLYREQQAWSYAKELLLQVRKIDSSDHRVRTALNDGQYLYEWDFKTMEKNYKTASKFGIIYCMTMGRHSEALTRTNQVYEKIPHSAFYHAFKTQALFFLDRKEEASALMRASDHLYTDNIMYLRIASRYHYYLGEYDQSEELLNILMSDFPDRPPLVVFLNAIHRNRHGDVVGARKYLNELNKRYEVGESGSPAWFTAMYYGVSGDRENTFKWLQNSYNKHETEMIWLREEPFLRPYRSDQRYQDLYKKVGFPIPPYVD
ncbi:MAG: helix-turn-helix domain-containing protein [Flavobacteriaceae bacterium]